MGVTFYRIQDNCTAEDRYQLLPPPPPQTNTVTPLHRLISPNFPLLRLRPPNHITSCIREPQHLFTSSLSEVSFTKNRGNLPLFGQGAASDFVNNPNEQAGGGAAALRRHKPLEYPGWGAERCQGEGVLVDGDLVEGGGYVEEGKYAPFSQ